MCNEDNLKVVVNDDRLYKQQEILHIMQLKINVSRCYFKKIILMIEFEGTTRSI